MCGEQDLRLLEEVCWHVDTHERMIREASARAEMIPTKQRSMQLARRNMGEL